jgi:NADH:ubiquinone oxidoreductase subunit 2 (subunit N)
LFFLGPEKNHLTDLAELKNSNVLLALLFTLIGFSMSGIPPLAGFFIKFNIFCSLFETSNYYASIFY